MYFNLLILIYAFHDYFYEITFIFKSTFRYWLLAMRRLIPHRERLNRNHIAKYSFTTIYIDCIHIFESGTCTCEAIFLGRLSTSRLLSVIIIAHSLLAEADGPKSFAATGNAQLA